MALLVNPAKAGEGATVSGSGVVITPRWILTARHLFTGVESCEVFDAASGTTDAGVNVFFGPSPFDADPAITVENDEPISVMAPTSLDACDDESVAADLAVVRTNRQLSP